MSIAFVVGAALFCTLFGLKRLAALFVAIFWIGITIANPALIFLWLGIGILYLAAKN